MTIMVNGKNVSIGKEFYFKRDNVHVVAIAKNIDEFLNLLKTFNEDIILFHLRENNNDFARWIRFALKDEDLADKISRIDKGKEPVQLKQDIIKIISKHIDAP